MTAPGKASLRDVVVQVPVCPACGSTKPYVAKPVVTDLMSSIVCAECGEDVLATYFVLIGKT